MLALETLIHSSVSEVATNTTSHVNSGKSPPLPTPLQRPRTPAPADLRSCLSCSLAPNRANSIHIQFPRQDQPEPPPPHAAVSDTFPSLEPAIILLCLSPSLWIDPIRSRIRLD